jgi:glutaredoxin-related protein
VTGKFVGGCDIVTEMHECGELATELKAAGVK